MVLIKTGTGAHVARPEDFRRVAVESSDTLGARYDPEVAKAEAEGFTALHVVAKGRQTEAEQLATSRSLSGSHVLDKRDIGTY